MFQSHTDIHAQGSVRGRIGYTFENVPILSNVFLYGTGGWAWMNTSFTRTQLVGITGLAAPGTAESAHSDDALTGLAPTRAGIPLVAPVIENDGNF